MSDEPNGDWQSNRKLILSGIAKLESNQDKIHERLESMEKFEVRAQSFFEAAALVHSAQEKMLERMEKYEAFQTRAMAIFLTVQAFFAVALTVGLKFWK